MVVAGEALASLMIGEGALFMRLTVFLLVKKAW